MNINIVRLVEPGIPNNERLCLRVISNDNLGKYVVYDTVELDTNVFYNKPKNTYWFPNIAVRAGDNIILYTKTGTNNSVLNTEGGTNYFFYWGLPNTIWNAANSGVALLQLESWQFRNRS